ncbi:MAG: N-acetyltransferase family protein [Bacteroidota bacterium]|nr:N-acetyltransferase family protein [Bacteroidota bacterium]
MKLMRIVKPSDVASILEIYTPYILQTAVTFETEIPLLNSFEERIKLYTQKWPWIVYEVDGMITGYAYATKYRERLAHRWCVESSVYIRDQFQREGIASTLYKALFEMWRLQGFINVYAGITLPNERSIAFHERLSFTNFVYYKNVGHKLGEWRTVG